MKIALIFDAALYMKQSTLFPFIAIDASIDMFGFIVWFLLLE